jgi:predicted dehydrogenase
MAAMPSTLRLGLVGLGDAGAHHARALLALQERSGGAVQWTALCARDPARLERFRQERGAPDRAAAFFSLEALLASSACDAVILATPDGLHAEQLERCAEQGRHVLVEKPLATTPADGARAARSCADRGRVLAVGYHLRHHAGHVRVHQRLGELLGRLRQVDVRWAWPDPAPDGWRARGRDARFWSLAALGTHGIDLAAWFAADRVVEARGVRVPAQGVDHAAEVSLRFANDVLAHVSCSVTHRAVSRLLLSGDRGEVECLGTLGARGQGTISVRPLPGEPWTLEYAPVDPYLAQLQAFVEAIAEGTPPTAPIDDALDNLAVLEALAGPGTVLSGGKEGGREG